MREITSPTDLLLPVLTYLGDRKIHTPEEIRGSVSNLVKGGERKGCSNCSRRTNWVAFTLKYFQMAHVIVKVGSEKYQINQRGRNLLAQGLPKISIETLKQYPEMRQALHDAGVKAAETRQAKSFQN